jgi:predicted nucleotidyltransferase
MRARTQVLADLEKLVLDREIYGAKVFGSVANETPSQRSDFDLLIVTESDDSPSELKTIFDSIRRDTKVRIEPIIVARHFALKGFHPIDLFFLQHLQAISNEGNLVGHDPMEVMRPINIPMTQLHSHYLAQKVRKFREGEFTTSQEDRYKVLQRALEAPINIGRRTMQVLASIGHPVEITDDRKPEVARVFREAFAGTNLIKDFNDLFAKDGDYSNYLQEVLAGSVTRNEYEEAMRNLADDSISQALRWTSELSLMYLDYLEASQEASYQSGGKERI